MQVPDSHQEFHRPHEAGVRWRLVGGGLETDDGGFERSGGSPDTVTRLWKKHHAAVIAAARRTEVPLELIVAAMAAATGGEVVEKTLPGYEDDARTPHRIFVGVMQTSIAQARDALERRGIAAKVDRKFLKDAPSSILAGAALIAVQARHTAFDPPRVAAHYAGGLREVKDARDRWRLGEVTGRFIDRFVAFYNDLWSILDDHAVRPAGASQWLYFNAARRLRTPLGPDDSALRGFADGETGVGGFYPLGLRKNLHTGVHLHGPAAPGPQAVRCMAPGWVVAARLGPDDPAALKLAGNHTGFVLVRHEVVLEEDPTPFPLYSLYMHLAPPAWPEDGKPDTGPYARVDWLDDLRRARNGSLVVVEPSVAPPGTVLFPAAEPPSPPAGKVQVLVDQDEKDDDDVDDGDAKPRPKPRTKPKPPATTREVDLGQPRHGERSLALRREAPAAVTAALDGLRAGKVVTFASPLLQLRAGEVLGFVEPTAGAPVGTSWLHWELFSPAEGGVVRLLGALRDRLGLPDDFVATVPVKDADDLYTTQELTLLLGPRLPAADRARLPGGELLAREGAEGVLDLMHRGAPLAFGGPPDDHVKWDGGGGKPVDPHPGVRGDHAACGADLTYPVTFVVKNWLGRLDAAKQKVGFKVSFEPEGLPAGTARITQAHRTVPAKAEAARPPANETEAARERREQREERRRRWEEKEAAGTWTVVVQVPARATRVHLEPLDDVLLDLQQVGEEDEHELTRTSARTLLPYRWRNVVLRGPSAWGAGTICKTLLARRYLGKTHEELRPIARALGWWAPEAGDEVALLGDAGASAWGTVLPAKGAVDHVHPTTGAWALEALADLGALRVVTDWEVGASQASQAGQWGWVTLGAKAGQALLGEPVHAVAVTRSLVSGPVRLGARGAEAGTTLRVEELIVTRYRDGVAAPLLLARRWGTWTLLVDGQEAPADAAWGQLPRTLTVPKPTLSFLEEPARSRGRYRFTLWFNDHCPKRLEGWVLLSTFLGGATEPTGAGEAAPFCVAVDARPVAPKRSRTADVTYDATNQFFTKARAAKIELPWAGSRLSYGEWLAAAPRGKFKLSVLLAQLVARIRARYGGALLLSELSADGLGVRLRCWKGKRRVKEGRRSVVKEQDTRTPELHAKLVEAVEGIEGFASMKDDGEWVAVSVFEPGPDAGLLAFDLDPQDAFQRLLDETTVGADQRLHVTFGVAFPSGGRHVEALEPGRSVVEVTSSQVHEACRGEWLSAWAEEASTRLAQPRIEPLTAKVVKVKAKELVEVQAKLVGGTFAEWHAARPQLFFVDGAGKQKKIGQMLPSKHLLSGQVALRDLGGHKATFVARTTTGETQFGGHPLAVAPVQLEYTPPEATK